MKYVSRNGRHFSRQFVCRGGRELPSLGGDGRHARKLYKRKQNKYYVTSNYHQIAYIKDTIEEIHCVDLSYVHIMMATV